MTREEAIAFLRAERARFSADVDAFDRVMSLLSQPVALLPPPELSLPLRVQPAKASALGWSTELYSLTVLIGNARVEDSALLPASGPTVAVCAEYDQPLISLDPPSVAGWALQKARSHGMPTVKLPTQGFWKSPLRLETTNRAARSASMRGEARAKAGAFLTQLAEAWKQHIAAPIEVAWPVYRHPRGGPLLDGVHGTPLPALALT